jgi:hypothetical protein
MDTNRHQSSAYQFQAPLFIKTQEQMRYDYYSTLGHATQIRNPSHKYTQTRCQKRAQNLTGSTDDLQRTPHKAW